MPGGVCFTFTAPVFTAKQEQQERAALTEAEKARIALDVFGAGGAVIEDRRRAGGDPFFDHAAADFDAIMTTHDMEISGLGSLQEALNTMPLTEKQDYLTALQSVQPEAMARESPQLAFLRSENWNASAAAKRLNDYWKLRVKIFGSERAYLPMTLDGAMAGELEHLEKGLFQVLPDDTKGRAVLFWNRVESTKDVVPPASIFRCAWYAMQCLVERESIQQRGYAWILNLRNYDLYRHFDRSLTKQTMRIVNVMPIRCNAHRGCTGPGISAFTEVVLPMVKHMFGKHQRLRVVMHEGSASELEADPERYGMDTRHVQFVFATNREHRHAVRPFLHNRHAIERQQRGSA